MSERLNGVLMRGHVKELRIDRQFGFIDCGGGVDAYFAPHNLQGELMFGDDLVGREVLCYVEQRDGGKYRARGVRPAW